MNLDNFQLVFIIIVIPIVLCIMMIMEGVKILLQAESVSIPKTAEQLDDESIISGRNIGCLGVFYIALGFVFLGVIGYVYLFLAR